jgi:murein DD-endopeptidase MepM/ murein hydrolase activator NlpD
LQNASVGMQRVLSRLRPAIGSRPAGSIRFHRRSVRAARGLRVRAGSVAASVQQAPRRAGSAASAASAAVPRGLHARFGSEPLLPIAVIAIVLAASLLSWLPGTPASAGPGGGTGGTDGAGAGPRLAFGGDEWTAEDWSVDAGEREPGAPAANDGSIPTIDLNDVDPDAIDAAREAAAAESGPRISGPFLADGTLLKPMAVNTTVADGKDLLRSYTVRNGDSLTGIANRFGVSMMTIWWANDLKTKGLVAGQDLVIPPVDGLVVTVREGDTLETLATRYKVTADAIYETSGLEDRSLVTGQTLILPGAVGEAIATPKPKPPVTGPSTGGSGGGTVRPPASYGGGAFAWPVVGGGNYVSQGYHYGHYGLDIAADYGSRVRSAAGGTVIWAGWKSNGGGYQVWIAHGSGLYTTYNHMSGVSVGRGQAVGKGQQVGRIGTSGWASGPHLHFEVWRGPVWNGGQRVNPLRYL